MLLLTTCIKMNNYLHELVMFYSFIDYRVLTTYGIITSNALNYKHKASCFPLLLPPISVKQTITDTVINIDINQSDPAFLSWLAESNSHNLRNSLFFKGPLLYSAAFCPLFFKFYGNINSTQYPVGGEHIVLRDNKLLPLLI